MIAFPDNPILIEAVFARIGNIVFVKLIRYLMRT